MKTPIEKAAEEISSRIAHEYHDQPSIDDIATIIRRVLSEEVPEKPGRILSFEPDDIEECGYNQCRRDIGLEDL